MFICVLFLSKIKNRNKKNFFNTKKNYQTRFFHYRNKCTYANALGKGITKTKKNRNNKRSDQRTHLYIQVPAVVLKLSGKNRKAKSHGFKASLGYVSFIVTFLFFCFFLQTLKFTISLNDFIFLLVILHHFAISHRYIAEINFIYLLKSHAIKKTSYYL